MASVTVPHDYCAVRGLTAIQQAGYRLAIDSGKFGTALSLLPPASRPDVAADIWESLSPDQRPGFIADLVNVAGNTVPSYLFAGFIAQALCQLTEAGQIVTDCPASLRCYQALPAMVIAWRAAEAGDLPGRGLVWHLQHHKAVEDLHHLHREGTDALVFVLKVPRSFVAGVLAGMRLLIEPRHAQQAEPVNLGVEL
jgi:hypothetical protein